jgi:hypothetical protein
MLAAPFVLVAAALAGILFLILLPVCGLASIAEGIASAAWRLSRDLVSGRRRPHPSRT